MTYSFKKSLVCALVILAQLVCGNVVAQDVDINFVDLVAQGHNDTYTVNGVTFNYIGYDKGANIYLKENDSFSLKINSSSKKIVRVEFKGEVVSAKYSEDISVRNGNGQLSHLESGTFVWQGSSDKIQFWGSAPLTGYYVQGLRLWFEGSEIITDEKEICATPDVYVMSGNLVFYCADAGATYHYTLLPKTASDGVTFDRFTISFYATAPGKDPSALVVKEFPMADIAVDK